MSFFLAVVYLKVFICVSSTVQDGATPLFVASEGGHAEVVDALLKSGTKHNLVDMVRH